MHRAMRLRGLLRPQLLRTHETGGALVVGLGEPGGSAVARRPPPLPFGDGRRRPSSRFYCSKGGVGSVEAAVGSGGGGSSSSSSEQEHARLGERDQKEWLSGERFVTGCRRRESPFLTKRERFRDQFLRRVVPWEKATLSWRSFPYYVE